MGTNASCAQLPKRLLSLALASMLARPARIERATPGFGGQYSIQLSYGTNVTTRAIAGFRRSVHP